MSDYSFLTHGLGSGGGKGIGGNSESGCTNFCLTGTYFEDGSFAVHTALSIPPYGQSGFASAPAGKGNFLRCRIRILYDRLRLRTAKEYYKTDYRDKNQQRHGAPHQSNTTASFAQASASSRALW